jgi:hypothetical protein
MRFYCIACCVLIRSHLFQKTPGSFVAFVVLYNIIIAQSNNIALLNWK